MRSIKRQNRIKFTLIISAFALLQSLLLMAKLVPNPPFPDMPWWVVFIPVFAFVLLVISLIVLVNVLTDNQNLKK